ncbi:MAG: hypothetical protein HY717_18300 [Planctomycetes bacterium]|nr:hypothetical protein [Planctomycetota bacterium]
MPWRSSAASPAIPARIPRLSAQIVGKLSYLIRGNGTLPCPGAADFDLSGELDITDPIALLRSRFLGDPPFGSLDPAQVPCD